MCCIHITVKKIHDRVKEVNALLSFEKYNDNFPVTGNSLSNTDAFLVLEGVFFLTNLDGTSRRCTVGDTVVLPKGWTGHCDILEPMKRLWVVAE